ncbi:MAG: HAMP domain-containing sensor histidine kinase [Anaerolineales bacterium]
MRSLTAKLLLAFVVVGLTGTAILALLAAVATAGEFGNFMFSYRRSGLTDQLADYYATNGSWEGLPRPSSNRSFGGPRPGPGGKAPFLPFLLVDGSGSVVVPGQGYDVGDLIAADSLSDGTSIDVDGEQVGILYLQSGAFNVDPAEQNFLNRVNLALAVGAVGGTAAAVVLGVVLSRSLTRPLRELTSGARAVAAGELDTQVPVRSSDELGELAEAFNQMNADLATSRDRRRRLTADVAHELRTPLSVILAHSEAIQDGVISVSAESLGVIHEEALRLERLVEDLRILSLVESGELPIEIRDYDPAALLNKAAASYRALAQEKDIHFEVRASEELPDGRFDIERMGQVLGNLVSNAMRHTPRGGQILLVAHARNSSVEIQVTDNGPGIDPEDLPHIFERFYRGDKSRQRDGSGSGLGLAIAKSLTEAQGGTIRAESQLGQGTTILLRIPKSI